MQKSSLKRICFGGKRAFACVLRYILAKKEVTRAITFGLQSSRDKTSLKKLKIYKHEVSGSDYNFKRKSKVYIVVQEVKIAFCFCFSKTLKL